MKKEEEEPVGKAKYTDVGQPFGQANHLREQKDEEEEKEEVKPKKWVSRLGFSTMVLYVQGKVRKLVRVFLWGMGGV